MTPKPNRTWWPDDILKREGFTPLANALLRHRERLGLAPDDLLVLIAILSRVMHMEVSKVRVSTSDLMRTTGRSRSTMFRCVERLEALGMLKVDRRSNQVNVFDVRPLFAKMLAVMAQAVPEAGNEPMAGAAASEVRSVSGPPATTLPSSAPPAASPSVDWGRDLRAKAQELLRQAEGETAPASGMAAS